MNEDLKINLDIETSRLGELLLIASYFLKKILPNRMACCIQASVIKRFCRIKIVK